MPRSWSARAAAHRDLRVTHADPQRGDDVKALQQSINARAKRRGIPPVTVDGIYGTGTDRAGRQVAEAMGLVLREPGLTQSTQRIIRRQRPRTPAQLARAAKWKRPSRKPQLITARQLGLRFQYLWGAKGSLDSIAGHYDAGTKVHSTAELVARVRSIHQGHLNLGHGGIAYEAVVAGRTIVLANPMNRKGAAVAAQNTGLASICVPGTAGDRMDDETRQTVEWLIANWHTRAIPAEHRLPRSARSVPRLGHKEFPGQSTQCPDLYLIDYRKAWA